MSPRSEGLRRARIRIVSGSVASCALLLAPSLSWAEDSGANAKGVLSVTFDCVGRTSDEKSLPSFATAGEAKFEVSATFGEGAIVALVNPETNTILKPLYDSETTTGRLSFSDGEETTIVWTRMSGVDGALVGGAITSDGDVLALTIEPGSEATQRHSSCSPRLQQVCSAEAAPRRCIASLSKAARRQRGPDTQRRTRSDDETRQISALKRP